MSVKRITAFIICLLIIGCVFPSCEPTSKASGLGNGAEPVGSMELKFATGFSVDYYQDGCRLITIQDEERFLIVPENVPVPSGISKDIVVLKQPIKNIYIAATAVMCLIDGLDRLDAIRLSGTKADDWYIENAKKSMEEGKILYAGKYSEPDYELILSEGCTLALESGMIGHASEVKDKLEKLGVNVFIDRSSYEAHPLGRTEWVKVYGVLFDAEEKADELFSEQVNLMDSVSGEQKNGKTVAFFRISSSGYAVARKSGDYVSRMIELAGGNYVFSDLGDIGSAMATVNVEMETFFKTARDADIIIYNSTIGGGVSSLDEFLSLSPLMKDMKAVKDGNVWCTGESMYQQTLNTGRIISELNSIFTAEPGDMLELKFFFRLD